MMKRRLNQINIIPRKRLVYGVVGLLLSSILFSTCATVFIGVYSYINTYLGRSEETLILTQSGTGNFIATRYISMQIADSAEYIAGVTLVSPETLTPCMINEKSCFVQGIICNKFYLIDKLTLDDGRLLADKDINGAFIGSQAASRLRISVGDSFIIYSGLRDVVLQVTAVGIFSSESSALNDEILVPLFAGQFLSGNYTDRINYIRVKYNESKISRTTLENSIIYQHNLNIHLLSNETSTPIGSGRIDVYDINKKLIKTGYTDSLGEVTFSLDFGNYSLTITYNQIQLNSSIYLQEDSEILFRIASPPTIYTLTVQILGENLEGIPFMTVIGWKGSEIIQMRQTNMNGEANFSLPKDIYQISTLFWNNFTQESIEFQQTINLLQNDSLVFWYHRFKLGIRTFDPSSGTFQNATVKVRLLNGTLVNSGQTGLLGYKEFQGLTPTTYNISIYCGVITLSQIIKLRSDRTINFEVLPQFNLQVNVFNDSTHLPINNSIVRIYDTKKMLYTANTGTDGKAKFLLSLGSYNVTIQAKNFIKNRVIYLNGSRTETFWMPLYNFTIMLTNLSKILQNNINVSIFSSSFNASAITQNGLATFFVPPDSYNISINCSDLYLWRTRKIFDPINPFSIICPPFSLIVKVFNGTDYKLSPISGVNISIFENITKAYINSSVTIAVNTSFLLNPGIYNVTANISGYIYYKLINLNQEYYNLVFYSFPFNLTIKTINGSTALPQPNLQVELYDLINNSLAGPNFSDSNGYTTFLVNPTTYKVIINNSIYQLSKIKTISNPNTILSFTFPPYNLTISVLNASNKVPIQNALIKVHSYDNNATLFSQFTSITGLAQFDLYPGKYYINLSYNLFNFIELKEIKADPRIDFLIPPYNVSIFVVDYWGNPIENASVSYNGTAPIKTNKLGYACFYLQPNFYNITVAYYNLTEFKLINIKTYKESFLFTVTVVPRVFLNISVVNAISGQFLSNISVQVTKFLGAPVETQLTNQKGSCRFHLQQGVYNVSIMNFKTNEYQLINLSLDLNVLFSIIPSFSLTILTFDDSATHFSRNVQVQISDLGGQLLLQDFTNNQGLCTFNVDYGTYNVSVKKGFEQKWKILDILQNEYLSFHVSPYKLTVKAINASLVTPIVNGRITITTLDGKKLFSNLTNQLGISEFLIDPGEYLIFLNVSKYFWIKQLNVQQFNTSVQITFSVTTISSSQIEAGDPSEYSASLLQQTLGLTESVVYILAIILTVLVSFSIMNVVSSCVSESRKSIGVLRSVGASNSQIYYVTNLRILLISFIAGVLGGSIGLLLGSSISIEALEISLAQILTFELSVSLLSLSIGITLLIGFISSNITLHRLLKMPIAINLKEILPTQT
jgi:ABC-type lipoprotein release transport system permease subunit